MIKKLIVITIISSTLSSCALWPYKKDFDCPIPEGEGCLSLHEVMKRADEGLHETGAKKIDNQSQKSRRLRNKKRGGCNAC